MAIKLKTRALLPAADPFYKAPSNLKKLAPGSIIRSRRVFVQGFNFDVSAYQILYRTTPANSSAIATATTLLVPGNADYSKLVSYSIAEDAAYSGCAPSYVLQNSNSADASIIQSYLSKGFPVTTSDHEGPDSSFTAGRLQGHAILDSIRASLAFKDQGFAGFKSNAKVVLTGYSGGGTAAAWAVALQPGYAKELSLAGAALGGVYANLEACLRLIDGTAFAGFDFPGVLGLSRSYSAYNKRLNEVATPTLQAAFQRTAGQCASDNLGAFFGERLLSTKYLTLGDSFTKDPAIAPVYAQQILGKVSSETPKTPLYIYHGDKDQISPVASVDSMYKNWCARNISSLQYTRVQGADHLTLAFSYQTNVLNWLTGRLNGVAAVKGCVKLTPSS